ncbi:MAG TPA: YIP1 family protein [Syntrophobacteria bacterium]|nr:YIP1 family protein [Syntrophobacteria bacterium]
MMEHRSSDPRDRDPTNNGGTGSPRVGGFLGTARAVLVDPKAFFQAMPVEGGVSQPYIFYLLCTSVFLAATLGLSLAGPAGLAPQILIAAGLIPILPFVDAALLHLFMVKFVDGTGSYESTFRVVCYASAVNLVTWVPLVGLVGQFYEIYLAARGASIVHRAGMGRTLLAVVATALVFLTLTLLLARSVVS